MKIYFSGIGGIGMSALAQISWFKGFEVIGSDIKRSFIIDKLERLGIKVFIEQSAKNIDSSVDLFVYSSSIDEHNPELNRAKSLGIKVLHRSDYLQEIIKDHRVIAVTGSSGKTTTTSYIAFAFNKMGIKANAIVGGWVKEWDSNVIYFNESDLSVIEADESDGSLLSYNPIISVINDLSVDLNINTPKFRDVPISKLKLALYDIFKTYVGNIIDKGGKVIFSLDNSIVEFIRFLDLNRNFDKFYFFGSYQDLETKRSFLDELGKPYEVLFYKGLEYSLDNGSPYVRAKVFYGLKNDYKVVSDFLFDLNLSTIGDYNISNALASTLVFKVYNECFNGFSGDMGGEKKDLLDFGNSLYGFLGPKRRFEILFNDMVKVGNSDFRVLVVDDYAHNPKKIYSLVSNLSLFYRDYYKVLIYQPHRYTRTLIFWDDLKYVFRDLDLLVVLPIYGSGESPIIGISSENLVKEINKENLNIKEILYIEDYSDLEKVLLSKVEIFMDKIFVFVGAGSITNFANSFSNTLKQIFVKS